MKNIKYRIFNTHTAKSIQIAAKEYYKLLHVYTPVTPKGATRV